MAELTPRHGLPLLQAGQAQKEVTHNEALISLDLLSHPVAEEGPRNDPPGTPETGRIWIAGANPAGAWAGQAHSLAMWTEGGWRFAPARAGMLVWLRSSAVFGHFDGTAWQLGAWPATSINVGGVKVVGERGAAINDPLGGTTIDEEARTTITQILTSLRAHGLITS